MELWQVKAADEMAGFMRGFLPVEEIDFYGSMLDRGSLDIFSDIDMEVHLQTNSDFNMKYVIRILSEHSDVFGYETHIKDESELLRICFENGWRFDISFMVKRQGQLPIHVFADEIDRVVNQFWFMASGVLVKIGRGDFLIASHLVLELCQLIITVQMLIRDREKNTNIHRFGDREDVPILSSLFKLKYVYGLPGTMAKDIVSLLYAAAEHMDAIAETVCDGYARKLKTLKAIQVYYGV
ncbi:MAG: hypothetical protein FWG31_09180 [Oscillospiraceae bacterium]|nr:hypothetical protein [Oscillospiraceae bacterium]